MLLVKERNNMTLPKVKNKKLIKEKEFIVVAKRVKKALEEEAKYINEKKLKNEDNIFHSTYSFS